MLPFEIYVLGTSSARPSHGRFNSAHAVNYNGNLFLLDCGEGTQIRWVELGLNWNNLSHIFLSHLHGDHCLGLVGFLSTMALSGRTKPIHLYAHADAERIFKPFLEYFMKEPRFEIIYHSFNPNERQILFDGSGLIVENIPLKHTVPCCGYLIKEKPQLPHIIREKIDFYRIPTVYIRRIKEGESWTTNDGTVVPNSVLTRPASAPRSYAYCTDTQYCESIATQIKGVDLLYHEATFTETEQERAAKTKHSTAAQAATIALKAEAKQLLIGHFSSRYSKSTPLLEEAKAIFEPTLAAHDKMTIKL